MNWDWMGDHMNVWMSGGHGFTMLVFWTAIIVGLIAIGYALGKGRRGDD